MHDPLRGAVIEVFDRQVGRPPAGVRERVLAGLSGAPTRRDRRALRWLPAVAAAVLSALVIGALLLGQQAARRHATPAASPAATPAAVPQHLIGAATAYDAARGQLVMFGGKVPAGAVTDRTWTWDGTRWTLPAPARRPPARQNALAAYDAAHREVVLFGGGLGRTVQDDELHDTWTWDGTAWTEHPGAGVPTTNTTGAIMAYDPASRSVLLLAVGAGQPALATWRWDGTRWTMLHPATSPVAFGAAAVSDGRRLLLVGGSTTSGKRETWAWDGAEWSRLAPPAVDLPAGAPLVAYDEARGVAVALVGPTAGGGPFVTLTWDGATWVVQHPAHVPPRLAANSAYYDARSRRVVAFLPDFPTGGAWTWDGADWSPASGP